MAERVVLHIGAPKSGTTFIQSILFASQEDLRGKGVLVPGRRRFDHTRAASAVSSPRPDVIAKGTKHAVWDRFVSVSQRWPGLVVISDEWFVSATQEQAERAIADLAPADVHVVFTARDFVRQVPAAWQEELKLGFSTPLDDFIHDLDDLARKWSWATLDPAEVLPRWAQALEPDCVHVVTVPPTGTERGVLWERFCAATLIDPRLGDPQAVDSNESLGAESARLLQTIGPALREAIDADSAHWEEQYKWLRRFVAHEVLAPLGGSRIGLDPASVARLRERSASTIAAIETAGWDVVGDVADLTADAGSGRHPDSVSTEEQLDAAIPLVAGLLVRAQAESRRADRAEQHLDALGEEMEGPPVDPRPGRSGVAGQIARVVRRRG